MANEPRRSPRSPHSPHDAPGHSGNADGVVGEQQHRPSVAEKVKFSVASVKEMIKGHASNSPRNKYHDDPQMYVGHPSLVYGNGGVANRRKTGAEDANQHRPISPISPISPVSPVSPVSPIPPHSHTAHASHVAVGHNPEFEPVGVGEQAADTVMPGHHVDHRSNSKSPQRQPRAEKILELLPGYPQNPYKHYDQPPVGGSLDGHEHHHHPSPLRDPERQHVVGEPGSEYLGEGRLQRGDKRVGFITKLKDLVGGQKPGHGTATAEQTAGIKSNSPGGTQSYTQEPTPFADGDCVGDVKHKTVPGGQQDAKSPRTWPLPAKPDDHHMPGAVRTDEQGKPIEGPKDEGKSPKSERVMSKIMEKLHIGQQKPVNNVKATSPTTATTPDATT